MANISLRARGKIAGRAEKKNVNVGKTRAEERLEGTARPHLLVNITSHKINLVKAPTGSGSGSVSGPTLGSCPYDHTSSGER